MKLLSVFFLVIGVFIGNNIDISSNVESFLEYNSFEKRVERLQAGAKGSTRFQAQFASKKK